MGELRTVCICFNDMHEINIRAFIDDQFYLFDGMSSLTLYIHPSQVMVDDSYVHYCMWDSYDEYEDVTIDFKKKVYSISIKPDQSN